MLQSRHIFISVLLFVFSVQLVTGKEKIVDKSGKKPKWVKETTDDFKVSVKAPTLFECKQKNRETFKLSVTLHLISVLDIKSDSAKQARLKLYLNQLDWQTIKGKDFAPIVGFSDSLQKDYYWEKQRLSRGGYLFKYQAIYHCTTADIKKIAANFDLFDNQTSILINPIKTKLKGVNSVNWLLSVQDTLLRIKGRAHPNFHSDIDELTESIKQKLSKIELIVLTKTDDKISFKIEYEGTELPINKQPKITSTCALIQSVKVESNVCTVLYSSKYCLDEDPESGLLVEIKSRNQNYKRLIAFKN